MAKGACRICDEHLDYDPDLSDRENARVLEIGASTVRRHRHHAGIVHEACTPKHRSAGDDVPDGRMRFEFGDGSGSAECADDAEFRDLLLRHHINPDAVVVDSRRVSEWEAQIKGGGIRVMHAVKISFHERTEPAQIIDLDAVRARIREYRPAVLHIDPENETSGTLVVCCADMQAGKTDVRAGTDALIDRVLHSYHRAAQFAQVHRVREIILADLGDSIENFTNVSSQAQTSDRALTEEIQTVFELLLEGIRILAAQCERLIVVSVPSNHCQVRTERGHNPANHPFDDYGLLINRQLETALALNPDAFGHVRFVRPARLDESVAVEADDGTVLGFLHGHQTRGPDKFLDWWRGQSFGRQPIANADIACCGHWHHLRVAEGGDGRLAIIAPASESGSSWVRNTTGDHAEVGMLTFLTDCGRLRDLEIA